jgi:hypothetical protein
MNFKKLRQMIIAKGNGKLLSKTYEVSSFVHLHVSVNGHVELYQSNEEKVVIEADDNLHAHIGVVNSGRTLFVSSEEGYRRPEFTSLTVKIYFRQLNRIYFSCERGEIKCPKQLVLIDPVEIKIYGSGKTWLDLDVPVLKLHSHYEGDIMLMGKCQEADIRLRSEGNVYAKTFIADSMKLNNRSEGDIELRAESFITIRHLGEGNIHYYGNAVLKDVHHHGEGEIKHINAEL